MTYLTLRFKDHKAMCEWIEDQEQLINNSRGFDDPTMLHYRKFDSLDWAAKTAQYVLVRDGAEE